MRAIYASQGAADTEQFFDNLYTEARSGADGQILDSVARKRVVESDLTSENLPESALKVLDRMPQGERKRVFDSVLIGMDHYRREHGELPTADVIESALHQGFAASHRIDNSGRILLDNVGDTGHHDQISAMPNRIVVAITSAIAEACPFGAYLSADIGSNESKLGIVSHLAGSSFGDYTAGEIMDGINSGKGYLGAERRIALTSADQLTYTGQVFTQTGGATGVKLLRGRTLVLVDGFLAGGESVGNSNSGAATSPLVGSINIAGTDYAFSGTVTIATGAITMLFAPALPANTTVDVEGFIDFEAAPTLAPKLLTQVSTYSLFASPWRALAEQTIDSRTQYQNELALDLQSENLIAVRTQYANERHYMAIAKALRLAKSTAESFDFDYAGQMLQKTRAQIWQDVMAKLAVLDQRMAENTMDHGITHLYMGKLGMGQMHTLPRDIFEPSGIEARPGIYRIGRLFNRYEVYYTPRGVVETADSMSILCVGRSTQPARNPIVFADAVAPTILPLATGEDMKYKNAFYARNLTSVNPHKPSAYGCAILNITNLF